MRIEDHKLLPEPGADIEYKETPNKSGSMSEGLPDTIVIHYTGGRSLDSSVRWLTNTEAGASAHIVIGKEGKIVQLAPFNLKTWHAGVSRWKNRESMNNYSIGIELDNAGLLEKRASGYYTYFDLEINKKQVVLATHKNESTEKPWEAFPLKQLDTVEDICRILKKHYPIKEIVGHDDVAPDRKIDPGPAFPLKSLNDKIFVGRKGDEEEIVTQAESGMKGIVTADFLNIRTKPNIGAMKVTDPLAGGTKLRVLEKQDGWYFVKTDLEGWVSSRWVKTSI